MKNSAVYNNGVSKADTTFSVNSSDVYKSSNFSVYLKDASGNKISGTDIDISINGVVYTRNTDCNGMASLTINLNPGKYQVNLNFKGNEEYNPCSNTLILTNQLMPVSLSTSNLDMYYKDTSKVVAVLKDSNGKILVNQKILITINGVTYTKTTNNQGLAFLTVNLNAGTYYVNIKYQGDNTYKSVNNNIKVTVKNRLPYLVGTQIICNGLTKDYGEEDKLTVTLKDTNNNLLTGKPITININNVNYDLITDYKGQALLNINLNPNTYKAHINFNTGVVYRSNTVNVNVNIKQKTTNIETNTLIKYYGSKKSLTGYLKDNTGKTIQNKNIQIFLNGVTYTKTTDSNGKFSLAINLPSGSYTANINFNGDNCYFKSSKNVNVLVKSTIGSSNIVKTYGDGNSFKATFLDCNGNSLANSKVSFTINGVTYSTTTNNIGVASLNINLDAGNYAITSINTQTGEKIGNIITINKASTNIEINDFTKYFNGIQQLTGYLKDSNGKIVPNKNVQIVINGVTYTKTTDNNGKFSLAINLPSGSYTANINFNGDNCYFKSSKNVNVLVKSTIGSSNLVKTYGDGNSFKATFLDSNGNNLANSKVSFTINGVTYSTITNNIGVASLNINLDAGNYAITSINTQTGEKIGNIITINKASTNIEINDFTKYFNEIQQLTGYLKDSNGKIVPNKNVQIVINGVTYTKTTDNNGKFSLAINLPSGNYPTTIKFNGDVNYINSNKGINTLVKSTISSNNFVKTYSDNNSFKATFLDSNGNNLANSKVSFTINGVTYSRTTDNNGIASININLDAGNYSITIENTKTGEKKYSKIVINKASSFIECSGLTKGYGSSSALTGYLKDSNGKVLPNKVVQIAINGQTYTKITDNDGKFSLNINLLVGLYSASICFNGDYNYLSSSNKVDVTVVKGNSHFTIHKNVIGNDDYVYFFLRNDKGEGITDQNVSLTFANDEVSNIVTAINGLGGVRDSKLNKGSYDLSLNYLGSDLYLPSNLDTTIQIEDYSFNKVKLSDVVDSAVKFNNYLSMNNSFPSSVKVGGLSYSLDEFVYLMAKTISNIDDNGLSVIYLPLVIQYYDGSSNNETNDELTKYSYVSLANDVVLFTQLNNFIPNNATVDTSSYISTFAKILSFYNSTGKLPSKINFVSINYTDSLNELSYDVIFKAGLNEKCCETDLSKYLGNGLGTYSEITPEIQDLANLLDMGSSDWDKASNIYNYVRDCIDYQFYYGSMYGASGTLEKNFGNYVDQANLLVALCRAANIPVRYCSGTCKFTHSSSYHCWVQILVGDTWYVADPTSIRNYLGVINNWDVNSINGLYYYTIENKANGIQKVSNKGINLYSVVNNTNKVFEDTINYNEISSDEYNSLGSSNNMLSTFLTVKETSIAYGSNLVIYLRDEYGNGISNQKVSFYYNNQWYSITTDISGYATFRETLPVGNYNFIFKFETTNEYVGYTLSKNIVVTTKSSSFDFNGATIHPSNRVYFKLVDSDNKALSKENINLIIMDSNYNIVEKYNSILTDSQGLASVTLDLNPGEYIVFYEFKGTSTYLGCYGEGKIKILPSDTPIATSISLPNQDLFKTGSLIEGKLLDESGNPLASSSVNVIIKSVSSSERHSKEIKTDSNGYFTVQVNLDDGKYVMGCIFNGNNNYGFSKSSFLFEVRKQFSNMFYTINFTNDGRLIGINRGGNCYMYTFDCNVDGATRLNNGVLYFFSLINDEDIRIVHSEKDFATSGILLICNGEEVLLSYCGLCQENISYFSSVFNGNVKYFDDVYHCEDLNLYYKRDCVASLFFSREQNSADFDYGVDCHFNVLDYNSKSILFNPESSDFFSYIYKYLTDSKSSGSNLFYGYDDNEELNSKNWNSDYGYELVDSYLITNQLITKQKIDEYYNNYDSKNNVIYDTFLNAITYEYLREKLANQLLSKYGSKLKSYGFITIQSGLKYSGRYIHIEDDFIIDDTSYFNVNNLRNEYSLYSSLLEAYVINLNNKNAYCSCAVSEIIKALLNGEQLIFSKNNDGFSIKLPDGTAELNYSNTGGFGSFIYIDNLNNKYNGGWNSEFTYGDISDILTNGWKLISGGINSLSDSLINYLSGGNSNLNTMCSYIVPFLIGVAGSCGIELGVACIAGTCLLTGPVGWAVGAGLIVGGCVAIAYSDGLFEDSSPKNIGFTVLDIGLSAAAGPAAKIISKTFGFTAKEVKAIHYAYLPSRIATEETVRYIISR